MSNFVCLMTVLKRLTQLSEVVECCNLTVTLRSFLKLVVEGSSVSATQVFHHNIDTVTILIVDDFTHFDNVWMIESQHHSDEWIIISKWVSNVALLECFKCVVLLILSVDALKD